MNALTLPPPLRYDCAAQAGRPGMQNDLIKLIDELLTRELRPNTREDLGEFRQQIAAGTLAADDDKYIRALHARVVGGGVPKAAKPPAGEAPDGAAPNEKIGRAS